MALVGAFLLTRSVMVVLAANHALYPPAVVSDVLLYRQWGSQVVASSGLPYS